MPEKEQDKEFQKSLAAVKQHRKESFVVKVEPDDWRHGGYGEIAVSHGSGWQSIAIDSPEEAIAIIKSLQKYMAGHPA